MQMAEAALLTAVRAKVDAIVVADGTSYRHQIADGTARGGACGEVAGGAAGIGVSVTRDDSVE